MSQVQRKQKFVNKRLQFRFLGLCGLFVFVTLILQFVMTSYALNRVAMELPTEGALVLESLALVQARGLWITLGLLAPLVFSVGALFSHRIAGPLDRVERYFEGLARGEEVTPLRFRKNDELHEVATAINAGLLALLERGDREPVSSTDEEPASLVARPGVEAKQENEASA